jgi:hypothetical protein
MMLNFLTLLVETVNAEITKEISILLTHISHLDQKTQDLIASNIELETSLVVKVSASMIQIVLRSISTYLIQDTTITVGFGCNQATLQMVQTKHTAS